MDFLPREVQEYADAHTMAPSPLLQEIDLKTNQQVLHPRMISGHAQGRLLAMISQILNPSKILEIGTYTGYSALCLAEGLQDSGRLITIEINEELAKRIRQAFDASELGKKIELIIGNALEEIPKIEGDFDLVFIDADKENYLRYYDLVLDKVRKGGIIIADNVLWSGKVLTTPKKNDKDTRALIEFNKAIQNDARVENLLLPVRDGLMVIRKL